MVSSVYQQYVIVVVVVAINLQFSTPFSTHHGFLLYELLANGLTSSSSSSQKEILS
jgi:hypothetical protein|tara:strand:- start:106 stop:273 length:168 start_codon:yes stop_codon:yes gene_type:complete